MPTATERGDDTFSEDGMTDRPERPGVRAFAEYAPIAAFFLAYMAWDLFAATAALMVATAAALALSFAANRSVPMLPLVTAGVVGVFGGLTLLLDDEIFIKMKPTIVQSLIALVLFGGLAFGKPLLRPALGSAWSMTEVGWLRLTRNFGAFFLCMAVVNEIVWRTQPTDVWVSFKVFGILALTFAFTLSQIPLVKRHRTDRSG